MLGTNTSILDKGVTFVQYRPFGKLGFDVSTFGMGCMRLPTTTDAEGNTVIDEKEAIAMIRHAADSGVNYFDTAYVYHNQTSEIVVGKAMQDGYREKVRIADTPPPGAGDTHPGTARPLAGKRERLPTGHTDFLLLHSLDRKRFDYGKELGALKFLDKALEQGKILHPAFSMHDNIESFKYILDSYPFEMCQIQLNFLDDKLQAGVEGLKYAADKGVPVVIMEPLKGGKLANNIPKDVQALWDGASPKRTPVEWAFRWLYNFPEATTILSGVSSMEQLQDNLRIFSAPDAKPGVMTADEQALIAKAKEIYMARTKVGCTGCAYCMPCPQGIHIPDTFTMYNDLVDPETSEKAKAKYANAIKEGVDASICAQCGACEAVCPQAINIIDVLKEADAALR